ILNQKREDIVALERRHQIKIVIDPKGSLLRHESEFEFFPRERVEVPPALVAGDRPAPPAPPALVDLEEPEAPGAVAPPERAAEPEVAETEGERRKRRRRGRRGGRGRGRANA